MGTYNHGVRVLEEATALSTPIVGTAGLQVIFGTAPINLSADPYSATNKPKICYSFAECVENFGYSDDFAKYTLCQSMDVNFRVFNVAPIILVNVLDPTVHIKANVAKDYPVSNLQALVNIQGILLDTVTVKNETVALVLDSDYVLSFDDDGYVVITLLESGTAAGATTLSVESTSIDPTAITATEIIGGYDVETGTEKGLELVRQIYPLFGLTPGLLLAPGWSHMPTVGAMLAAKSESINGVFRCENILDLDTTKAKKYTDCKTEKEASGYIDKHSAVLWPKVKLGDKVYYYSAVFAALTAYTDANNDDVPNLSPSNKLIKMTGAVLEDGTEVVLDTQQANLLNGQGIITAINDSGWKSWGNNSACYPTITDPKDRWWCCRRFFSWWGNSFILTYKSRVDDPANRKLIEAICDTENIRGNSYVSQDKCAGARIEFTEADNPITGLIDGKLQFRQHLAPYTPAEDIVNILAFDPDMLMSALTGGN